MMFLEFLNKYNDFIFFAHLFFGVTHFSMILFDNLYWDRHNYNSIDNNTECRLHMKLNSIDDKLHEILIQVSSLESKSKSDSDSESIIVSETDSNNEFNCNLDTSCNIMTDSTSNSGSDSGSDSDSNSDSNSDSDSDSNSASNNDSSLNAIDSDLDSLTYSESESNLKQDDNVCVNQDDINEYFKDKVRERQNSRSLSLSGVFSGWY